MNVSRNVIKFAMLTQSQQVRFILPGTAAWLIVLSRFKCWNQDEHPHVGVCNLAAN